MMRRRRVGRPGIVGMAARTAVVAGTATAVSNKVAHKQQQKYAAQEAPAQPAPPPPAPGPAPAAGGDDMVSKLKELAGLHDSGVLSDEEFEAAKAKLIG